MTSVAYTVGQYSIGEALAEGCPTRLFPQRYSHREDCRREEAVYGTPRFEVWALSG